MDLEWYGLHQGVQRVFTHGISDGRFDWYTVSAVRIEFNDFQVGLMVRIDSLGASR
jgi:hypothetical protein